MLFNSYEYLFLFFPIMLILYFFLNSRGWSLAAKSSLILASIFFYGYWNPRYIALILGSILFNYVIGACLVHFNDRTSRDNGSQYESPGTPLETSYTYSRFYSKAIVLFKSNKTALTIGIVCNLILLAYYKYVDFFIANVNYMAKTEIPFLHVILPLGISFFTFTQIAYLVDCYRGKVKLYRIDNYILFVTFFPHLLAGPIIHHKEMMPQFDDTMGRKINYRNISIGFIFLALGLFKKVVIADALADYANAGFSRSFSLSMIDGWITSLSYTFQLYFDFSGYTDMAIGSSYMFNIVLPINFNSPYKAVDIRDFWRRWHVTLSRFMRDYIYIPLGGNRRSEFRTLLNLALTFLIGGLWHGAGWTFVFWGFLHGLATVVHRLWLRLNIRMPDVLGWILTFSFVNVAWVFFRAKSFDQALDILRAIFGINGTGLAEALKNRLAFFAGDRFSFSDFRIERNKVIALFVCFLICLITKNSNEIVRDFRFNMPSAVFIASVAVFGVLCMSRVSEFIYFNF